LFLGAKNKMQIIEELANKMQINLSEIAYVGDDINDYVLLQNVGLSAAPSSAPTYIKEVVDWVLEKKGGDGVFREFVEKILLENNINVIDLLKDTNLITHYKQ